jgi:hypothetical protein
MAASVFSIFESSDNNLDFKSDYRKEEELVTH